MSDLAIRCEGVAKQYRIGKRESYRALRDTLTDAVSAPFRRVRAAFHGGNGRPSSGPATIWALKDVSLEIHQGEVVGIIGRNGAGKSTLLKILSRITKPTRGAADIYGRVGSLLEVGTGFHPELTGRENVYLNGAILGMKKAEITRKFDEIVAFSELEKFIDTPVKRYSSGMYMRLAFAVAAHLDPEILTVDEVLAVGDAQFQNKCLRKMNDVAEFGRTILFVSHSMASVQRLCGRCVLLEEGSVKIDGPADNVIAQYLSDRVSSEFVAAAASNTPSISRAEAGWTESDGIRLDVTFISPFPLRPPILGLVIHDSLGAAVFGSNGRFDLQPNLPDSMQEGTITVYVSTEALRSGTYYVSLFLGDHVQDYCRLDRILSVEVGIGNEVWAPPTTVIGNVRLQTRWEYSEAPVREELRSGPTEGFRG